MTASVREDVPTSGLRPRALAAASAGCGHCGLPSRAGDRYCCYGCELASEIAREAEEDHSKTKATMTFSLLLSMTVMMFSLFLYAEDIYGAGDEAGLGWMRTFYRAISVVLATPVMGLCGVPLVRHAWRRGRERHLSMSALIALGAFAAYGLSVYSVLTGGHDVYLDSASTSLVLATLGRYLEATARSRASGVIGPSVEAGQRPVRVVEAGGAARTVLASEVEPGDVVELDPEQVVPVDLQLLGGPVEVDLGVLTGESVPVALRAGELVCAGAVPVASGLRGVALRVARESTVERLHALALGLKDKPSRLMRVADGFARGLTPLVWALALGTLAYWWRAAGVERGVVHALSVVLVACPCSYAIATPLVHWLAMRRALRAGVLLRNAEVLERLTQLERVAFDKTGTLTHPTLRVARVLLAGPASEAEVSALVRALEEGSPHPVARALRGAVGDGPSAPVMERRFEAGRGVRARDPEGRVLTLGRGGPEGEVVLARDGAPLASFVLEERLRPEAPRAVERLRAMGLEVRILSGDAARKAAKVARALSLPFEAELAPEAKVARVAALGPRAAMVGDGLNDAPALAGATSFATQGATGLSRGLAQVNLLGDDLMLVPYTVELARRATRLIRRLLVASTLYNLVFLALAVGGLLRPVWAGLSMLIASLLTLATASGVAAWPEPEAAPEQGARP